MRLLRKSRLLATAFLFTLSLDYAYGQSSDADAEEEIYELSPFTVDESGNEGYRATNTLAGSRLNTNVADVGASIDILTTEFLEDVASTNILDAADWVGNIQRDTSGLVSDPEGNVASTTGRQLRIRGFSTGNLKQDFFPLLHSGDTYNTERITFNRGPNAILFGIGNPGGAVNTVSKRAQMKDSNSFRLRFDTFGSKRAEVDINRVLIDDKLALRFAAVEGEGATHRKPQTSRNSRQYIAATFRPHENTSFHLSYEQGVIRRSTARSWLVADGVSTWVEAGSNTVAANNLNAAGNRPPGIANLNNQNYLLLVDTEATGAGTSVPILNWRRFGTTAEPQQPFADQRGNTALLDESILPFTASPMGDANQAFHDFDHFLVTWDQRLLENLDVQLAYNKQTEHIDRFRTVPNQFYIVRADVNEFLPDGTGFNATGVSDTPNPNLFDPNNPSYFFETDQLELRQSYNGFQIARASLSYDLKFSDIGSDSWLKWLGDHRLAYMYEVEDSFSNANNMRLLNITPLDGYPTDIRNNNNRIRVRWFLDPDNGVYGPTSDWLARFPIVHRGDPLPADTDGDGIVPAFAPRANGTNREDKSTNDMFVTQSRFWNNRIIATVGWRNDRTTRFDGNLVGPDPVTRTPEDPVTVSPIGTFDPSSDFNDRTDFAEVSTWTRGAVFRPFNQIGPFGGLAFFYNESKSGNLGSGPFDINGDDLPARSGDGKDWGFRFSLFERKVHVNVNWFETSEINRNTAQIRGGPQTGQFAEPLNAIWNTFIDFGLEEGDESVSPLAQEVLQETGLTLPGGLTDEIRGTWQDTQDQDADGVEISLTANPTPSWRMVFKLSNQENILSNIGPRAIVYWQTFSDYLSSRPDLLALETADGDTTVGDEVALATEALANTRRLDGVTDGRQPLWNMNFTTNYSFRNHDGWIQPFSIGAGARWRDKNIIGYAQDDLGLNDPENPFYRADNWNIDFWLKYNRKILNDKVNWLVQLNVRNAFNDDGLFPMKANDDGSGNPILIRYGVPAPIHLILTNTFKF